jgi:hypothetical protein
MNDSRTPLIGPGVSTGDDDVLSTTTTTTTTAGQDNLARAVRVIGKVLLWCDLIWDIAWTVIAIIIAVRTTPLPSSLVSGLPLAVYDRTAEYRNAHYGIALHGFLPSVYFSLAAGYSHEPLVGWYTLPLGFGVALDLYANVQNWPHLSQDSIPSFFVLETVIATAAIVLSTAVFLWYQAAYWHFRWTGRHFNDLGPTQRHHRDDEPVALVEDSRSMTRDQRIKVAAHVSVTGTHPRLRTIP